MLRELEDRLGYLRNLGRLGRRRSWVLLKNRKATQDLRLEIMEAEVLQRVEDLYRPFRPKRSTRATKAKEKGLEPWRKLFLPGVEEGNLKTWQQPLSMKSWRSIP